MNVEVDLKWLLAKAFEEGYRAASLLHDADYDNKKDSEDWYNDYKYSEGERANPYVDKD